MAKISSKLRIFSRLPLETLPNRFYNYEKPTAYTRYSHGRAEDLPFILNWTLKPRSKALQKKVFVALGAEEKEIYNFLYTKGKSSLDSIAFNCKLPTSMAAYVLLSLELKGVLKPLPGKEYELI